MQTINNETFKEIIYYDLIDLISIAHYITNIDIAKINRRMLGRIYLESSKCEEVLDEYGANQNNKWYPLRKDVALVKSFSQVSYDLLHLKEAIPKYKLLKIDGDFVFDTNQIIKKFFTTFVDIMKDFLKTVKSMKLKGPVLDISIYNLEEKKVPFILEDDIKRKDINTRETTIYLATAFLNLSEEADLLKVHKRTKKGEYCDCFPDIINEETLRLLCDKFHNLQSAYDTYLSHSNIALKDKNLPIMRGQISVVYHLLDMTTILSHYYERHCQKKKQKTPISNNELLTMIMEYFVCYSDLYIVAAQNLCREVLKSYAIQGDIKVQIPNYRGFHVRPSTLISKIVIHYGSTVTMKLGESEYDASMPLELFRANEELNQYKRSKVSEVISKHHLIINDKLANTDPLMIKKKLRMIFLDLLENQKIILYDNNYSFQDITPYENESLMEFVKRVITRYLAQGKIDIINDAQVEFSGDIRVLEDIKILAENGYGEDKYGNNIVLPTELSYLRR